MTMGLLNPNARTYRMPPKATAPATSTTLTRSSKSFTKVHLPRPLRTHPLLRLIRQNPLPPLHRASLPQRRNHLRQQRHPLFSRQSRCLPMQPRSALIRSSHSRSPRRALRTPNSRKGLLRHRAVPGHNPPGNIVLKRRLMQTLQAVLRPQPWSVWTILTVNLPNRVKTVERQRMTVRSRFLFSALFPLAFSS